MQNSRNLKTQVMELLREKHLLSALEMKEILAKKGKKFHKTSIYRALEKLLDSGKICQHYFQDKEAVYELRAEDHAHLVCQKCGKVFSFSTAISASLEKLMTNQAEFRVDHLHLAAMGLCQKCQ